MIAGANISPVVPYELFWMSDLIVVLSMVVVVTNLLSMLQLINELLQPSSSNVCELKLYCPLSQL